jgi:hypothetical protein
MSLACGYKDSDPVTDMQSDLIRLSCGSIYIAWGPPGALRILKAHLYFKPG